MKIKSTLVICSAAALAAMLPTAASAQSSFSILVGSDYNGGSGYGNRVYGYVNP